MGILHSINNCFLLWTDSGYVDYFIQCGDSWSQCLVMGDFCFYTFYHACTQSISWVYAQGSHFGEAEPVWCKPLQHDGRKRGVLSWMCISHKHESQKYWFINTSIEATQSCRPPCHGLGVSGGDGLQCQDDLETAQGTHPVDRGGPEAPAEV